MQIRPSTSADFDAIHALHLAAFDESEAETVANLACDILTDESAEPLISLVADENQSIIGHIVFSAMSIQDADDVNAAILAPLAVAESHQKQGLGTQLIQAGLSQLKQQGVNAVFVLGDPNYYQRTGFEAGHHVATPYPIEYPTEAWMALRLDDGDLTSLRGVAKCCDTLMDEALW